MTQIAQGAHVYLFPEPGQVYRVQADDVATVQVLYGAPSAVITLTAQSQTFGPYDSPAKLKVTANTAPAEYTLIRAHYAELTPEQIEGGAVGVLGSNNAGGVVEPDGDVPTLGGSVTLPAMQTAFDTGTAPQKSAFQASVSGDAVARVQTADFGAASLVNGTVYTEVALESGYISQVSISWSVTSAATLYEVALYDSAGAIVVQSGVREHPAVAGLVLVALPRTKIAAGKYWLAVVSNSPTATLSLGTLANLARTRFTSTKTLPLPAAIIAGTTHQALPIAAIIEDAALPAPTPAAASITTSAVRVYGINPANSQPWGWNTATAKLCYSTNAGASYTDAMTYPPLTVGAPIDITISGGKLYLLTTEMEVWVASDLTSAATWTNISVPIATGWRRSIAKGRPYGLVAWNDWLFCGEYTSGVDMNTDPNWSLDQAGPRIFRYGPLSGTPAWVLSKQIDNARHIHSFHSPNVSKLWVSVGDLGTWDKGQKIGESPTSEGVGMHRLTAITAGGPDAWSDWTKSAAPFTTHYPVDFLDIAGRTDAEDGIYGASDSVGRHILHARLAGTVGSINISAKCFRQNSDAGETCRSIVMDASGNLYWWTVETADPGIYVSPPPYTQSYRIYTGPMAAVQVRSFVVSGQVIHYNQRFPVCKFPWQ